MLPTSQQGIIIHAVYTHTQSLFNQYDSSLICVMHTVSNSNMVCCFPNSQLNMVIFRFTNVSSDISEH